GASAVRKKGEQHRRAGLARRRNKHNAVSRRWANESAKRARQRTSDLYGNGCCQGIPCTPTRRTGAFRTKTWRSEHQHQVLLLWSRPKHERTTHYFWCGGNRQSHAAAGTGGCRCWQGLSPQAKLDLGTGRQECSVPFVMAD